jgi:hypothetical protein
MLLAEIGQGSPELGRARFTSGEILADPRPTYHLLQLAAHESRDFVARLLPINLTVFTASNYLSIFKPIFCITLFTL